MRWSDPLNMPLLENLPLNLLVDDVLRAQGADPAAVRARRPDLVDDAAAALEVGNRLLAPRVLYETYRVTDVRHRAITLGADARVRSEFLVEHLASADEVVVVVCTVGGAIERRVSAAFAENPVLALALHGVASAAVEALSVAATHYFEDAARARGWGVSVPLSPGMEGWPVADGQPQIFSLVDAGAIGVRLTENHLMQPSKSMSLLMGMGPELTTSGTVCDYCAVGATCRYRGSHV